MVGKLNAPVVVCVGEVRLNLRGLSVLGVSIGEFALLGQRMAPVAVRVGVIRL